MNLNQITIPVLNISRSISFYKNLGLQLIVFSEENYARFECPEGDSTFSLHQVKTLPIGNGIWVYFEINKIEEKINELRLSGFDFEEELNEKPWLWKEARIKDPDQNQIVLYEAGENRKNPPWRLK